ncbi:MAG TPA: response regulator [Panacibacter sp.]|nr:response regulator [Panacibacter sp.]
MKKILIIEDNDDVRENTAEILELSEYKVITASNGKEGVAIALKERPDLIVCDIMMPQLDGYGVLHLLSKHKETSDVPFIFLTAKSEKQDFRKGMELGADDYITKPFDGTELLNAIETRLKKAEAFKKHIIADVKGVNDFINNAKESNHLKLTSDERDVYEYKKKHLLYSENQRPKVVYFVVSGKIKIYKTSDDGKELITVINGPGDFFGYTAILEETSYKENAQALEDSTLMLIPREDFLELITKDTAIAKQFIAIITKNIIEKEEALLNLAYNSLRKKVAYGLSQLSDKYREPGKEKITMNISRENLAQTVGVATESLIRTLADFKSEGLIDIQTGKVILLDEKKLKNLLY